MLSIGKLTAGNERYYTDSVAKGRDDYYTGVGEAHGSWLGSAAPELGLSGRVDHDEFTAVISGRTTGGVSLRSGASPTRVDAFDLTFSAPKSVSLLFGVGDDRVSAAARDAHDEAVSQAVGYLEREACKVRRGHAGARVVPAEGVVAAAFRHRSSRAGDPQLHTHTVLANAGFAEGRWSALYGRLIYAHARTAGYLYQATLRDQLTRSLGVEWLPVVHGMAEIRGVDPHVLRHFSKRSVELEEHLNELGRHSRRSRELAALESRRRKEHTVPADRLRQDWRAQAAEQGFGRAELEAVLHRPTREPAARDLADAAARIAGPGGVTRNASTFDRRDVLRDWAQEQRAGASVDQVERLADAWLASADVVPIPGAEDATGTGQRYSTVEMLTIERALVDGCQRRRATGVADARVDAVEHAIRGRPSLSDEQAKVVRGLTLSGDGVQVLRAAAGTGKTFALDAAREAWEASGIQVVGCALSARAAVELQSQSGIRSDTVARLQRQLRRGTGVPQGGVLVVDEAGMVGSRQLAELANHAERAEAKLVLVGDDHQLPEIDAGGALRGIAKRIGSLQLTTVRRQQHDWDRAALDQLRRGRVREWAQAYRDHGRILAHPTAEQTRRALVGDWWTAAREPGADATMIAHRRADVADLNQRARQLMAADGRLGHDQVTVHERSFATGDMVLAKRNDRRLDIVNGARGTVVGVDAERRLLTVEVAGGGTVALDATYLDAGHLDHGYALTAHAAQGATVDKAFVLGSDDLYREWGYTALTRHRDEARYYAVSSGRAEPALPGLEPVPDPLLEDVVDALAPSRRKHLALDAAGGTETVASERPPGAFSELRAVDREFRRGTDEMARLDARLRDAELRRGELEAEFDATSRLHRSERAALRAAIERQDTVVDGWRAERDSVAFALNEIEGRRAALLDRLGPAPEPELKAAANDIDADVAPELDLDDDLDLGL